MSDSHIHTVETTSQLSESAKTNIISWLTHDKYTNYRDELQHLIDNSEWNVLEDSFFRIIPFGTGGRRGTVGVGSNRINLVTLGEAVQALCGYLKELNATDKLTSKQKIAIAYDSRLTSVEFSEYAAGICAANDYEAYLYDTVRSTPQLSFTVRHLEAIAGIVVSASHNPSTDNGIKIYWNDGGQLVPPYDVELLAYGENIETIHVADYQQAVQNGSIKIIGAAEDTAYYDAVLAKTINSTARGAKIAFSPLHGAGMSNVKPVLENATFEIVTLDSQSNYDGNFTNVTNNIPNPEVAAASDKVIAFGLAEHCDVALTTDPDADRLGVVVLDGGKPTFLSGNQIAALLCDYILRSRKSQGTLDGRQFIGKTIVTTDMLDLIAASYNVTCRGNLLVGFKYIGELIKLYEDNGTEEFVFGGEESFGSLVGGYARDKDAAGSALLISELTSQLKEADKTLLDRLDELSTEHGVFCEELDNISLKGAEGFATMKHIMNSLRSNEVASIGNFTVHKIRDYLTGLEIEGRSEDVLRFELSDDGYDRVTVRPSGTEPKLKLYTQIRVAPSESSLEQTKSVAKQKVDAVRTAFNAHINSLID